jgi:hypothetical protein
MVLIHVHATARVFLQLVFAMKPEFPTAEEYSSQKARYPAMTVVDIRTEQAGITDSYKNQVLLDINKECMRLSVFEGEYRWHQHPDSDDFRLSSRAAPRQR